MKKCVRCELLKEESEFYKDGSRKDGLSNRCKECDKKQHRKHADEHPEYKEKQLQRIIEWAKNNKETIVETKKKWREENRKRINEVQRIWRKNNPEKVIAQRIRDASKKKIIEAFNE